MPKSRGESTLGKALLKDRFRGKGVHRNDWVKPAEYNPNQDDKLNLKSVTAASDLDEFLSTASLAGTDFEAERYNIKLITPNPRAGVLTAEQKEQLRDLHGKHKDLLRIPRRPEWSTALSSEELDLRERKSFLEWRQQIATLAEIENLTVTPYEKNLEVWKQLWRVLERSDIVIQIVDCRNPLLYWSEDLTRYVHQLDPAKDSVVLLNKADLLPEPQRKAWADYFTEKKIRGVFFSAATETAKFDEELANREKKDDPEPTDPEPEPTDTEKEPDNDEDEQEASAEQGNDSDWESVETDEEKEEETKSTSKSQVQRNAETTDPSGTYCESRIYTRDELLDYLRVLHGKKETVLENVVTVGLVGYPNVGKSSTLNCLMQHKRVAVSATPGKTKHFQTMYVDDHLMLCDCPGLVMPSFAMSEAEMTCSGILPIDQLRDHIPPVNLLCSRIPRHFLEKFYGISLPLVKEYGVEYVIIPPPNAEELLNAYARKRGFVTARGLPDQSRAARLVLKDFVNGELLFCVAPPGMDQNEFFSYPEDSSSSLEEAEKKFIPSVESLKLNQKFFAQNQPSVHTKLYGSKLVRGPAPADQIGLVPTKRHGNRNKKEKLRRIFRDLDTH